MAPTLLLLLVCGAALVAATGNERCEVAYQTVFSFAELGPESSIVLTPQIQNDYWEARVDLGTKYTSDFQDGGLNLLLKKQENKNFVKVRLSQGKVDLMDESMHKSWLVQDGARISLSLSGSRLKVGFLRTDRQLLVDLTDAKLEGVDAVRIEADVMEIHQCSQPPSTTTTTIATTSTSTTTTTATTTKATSSTTKPTNTASDPSFESTTLPGGILVAGVVDGSQEEPEGCLAIPWWTWVCGGLAAAFFIFFLLLLCYTIVLCRRNWKLTETIARQGQHLRGRMAPPGGYGVEARDMQYYAVNNQNLMVGSTMPRIRRTPSPLPPLPVHCTAPRNSAYRRSVTNPPVLNFPAAPPGSPPPPDFLTLPPDACLVGRPDNDFHNELDPLNKDPQDKNRLHCSDGGLADDEVSDVSLSGEYGLKV